MAVNRCYDVARSRSRCPAVPHEHALSEPSDAGPLSPDEVRGGPGRRWGSCPRACAPIHPITQEGYSGKEIAGLLGSSSRPPCARVPQRATCAAENILEVL